MSEVSFVSVLVPELEVTTTTALPMPGKPVRKTLSPSDSDPSSPHTKAQPGNYTADSAIFVPYLYM